MGNTFGAHIFKRRSVGEREEVTLKLFNPDGTPLDLDGISTPPVDTGGGSGGTDSGAGAAVGTMVYKGVWDSTANYKKFDVVRYNPGDGLHTYIFNQDHAAGAPTILDANGNAFKLWDATGDHIDLVLGPDSKVGVGGYATGIYDSFAIKVSAAGVLSLKAVDTLGGSQDLAAYLWHQKPDSTWENVGGDDDGAGQGKPWIHYTVPGSHVMPGIYAYYISPYNSTSNPAPFFGTTRVSKESDNTAVIGSFADFPTAKASRIG